jgi:hypothetical protein
MPHLSSDDYSLFALLNGAMSSHPFVTASLQVGENASGVNSDQSPQYAVSSSRESAHGRLVWDADHRRNGLTSPFFTVAPVRFHLKRDECLLSVGTADYLRASIAPYSWIERIQVGAITRTSAPSRTITWDFIEIDFCYRNGKNETHRSDCLPRVTTAAPVRRALQAQTPRGSCPQQFTEISTHSREIVEIKLRGQVTLRANDHVSAPTWPLLAEDLQGRIHVFTDVSPGE